MADFLLLNSRSSSFSESRRISTNAKPLLKLAIVGSDTAGKDEIANILNQEKAFRFRNQHKSSRADELIVEIKIDMGTTPEDILRSKLYGYDVILLVYRIGDLDSWRLISDVRARICGVTRPSVQVIVAANLPDAEQSKEDSITRDCIVSIDWECPYIELDKANRNKLPSVVYDLIMTHQRKNEKTKDMMSRFGWDRPRSNSDSISQRFMIESGQRKRSGILKPWNNIKNMFKL